MLPIGDDNRDRLRWPIVTAVLIGVNVAAFLFTLSVGSGGERAVQLFITKWGVVPLEYASHADLPPLRP